MILIQLNLIFFLLLLLKLRYHFCASGVTPFAWIVCLLSEKCVTIIITDCDGEIVQSIVILCNYEWNEISLVIWLRVIMTNTSLLPHTSKGMNDGCLLFFFVVVWLMSSSFLFLTSEYGNRKCDKTWLSKLLLICGFSVITSFLCVLSRI